MFREQVNVSSNAVIEKIFATLGYEIGQDYEKLPQFFNLLDIDPKLLLIIPQLLLKIESDDNTEVGYMSKIRGAEIISSQLIRGTSDGEHVRFEINDFLELYKVEEIKKREKLLYDIHTHEVADIGPSPKDLMSLFKEADIFGCHFSIILTASKIYLLVRTKQTPSLSTFDAISHVNQIQEEFKALFAQAIKRDPNFIADRESKNRLLAEVNSEWLPQACKDNNIGLYEMDIRDFQDSQELQLIKK